MYRRVRCKEVYDIERHKTYRDVGFRGGQTWRGVRHREKLLPTYCKILSVKREICNVLSLEPFTHINL